MKTPIAPEPVRPEVMEIFVAAKIFEYDHISRNSDSGNEFSTVSDRVRAVIYLNNCLRTLGVQDPYEPIHVFDYAHGKRKSARFSDELSKNLLDGAKTDDPWKGGNLFLIFSSFRVTRSFVFGMSKQVAL